MPRRDTLEPRRHVAARFLFGCTPSARKVRTLAVVLTIALGIVSLKLPLESLLPQYAFRKDFVQEYVLARAVAERADPYVPIARLVAEYLGVVPEAVFPHPTPHPPTVGLLFLPLALTDYNTAAALWLAFEVVCLLVAVHVLTGCSAGLRQWRVTFVLVAAALAWYPFPYELGSGQLMIPMLALLACAWWALKGGRNVLGGVLLGVALLLKPVPWPLLILLTLRRSWRALATAMVVIVLGYGIAAYWVGPNTMVDYVSTVVPSVSRAYRADALNFSLSSLCWKVFGGTASEVSVGFEAPALINLPSAGAIASVALPAVVLLVCALWLRRQNDLDVTVSVMVGLSVLIAPISWSHYLVLLAIPAAYVIRWLLSHRLVSKETNWAIGVALLLWLDWGGIAQVLSGARAAGGAAVTVPFGLAMLPHVTTLAVLLFMAFTASLGRVDRPQVSAELDRAEA